MIERKIPSLDLHKGELGIKGSTAHAVNLSLPLTSTGGELILPFYLGMSSSESQKSFSFLFLESEKVAFGEAFFPFSFD